VQMKILSGGTGGILFRDSGGNGKALFYYLSVSQDGYYDLSFYVDKQSTNSNSLMSGNAPSFRTGLGQINTISVIAKGDALSLFINGNFVDSRIDSSSEQGTLALVTSNISVVVFSDV